MTSGPGPYVMVIVFDNSDWALSPVICALGRFSHLPPLKLPLRGVFHGFNKFSAQKFGW